MDVVMGSELEDTKMSRVEFVRTLVEGLWPLAP